MQECKSGCAKQSRCCNLIKMLVALLLLALLLLRGCHYAGNSTAATTAAVGTAATVAQSTANLTATDQPATMPATIASDASDGKLTLSGVVKDQATKDALLKAATDAYGVNNVTDNITINAAAEANSTDWAGVMTWQKSNANNQVIVNGQTVTLKGQVIDATTKADREVKAKTLFGEGFTIDNQLEVLAAAVNQDDAACKEALLHPVEFATGSATLTQQSKKMLDKLAGCFVSNVEVAGYTDNQGNDNSNLLLSEARAKSVVAYLISKGVLADHLTAKGYGSANPVASNDTAEGRKSNRRIVFVAN